MPVLLVCGPEKAGKTTLCNELVRQFGCNYRHWGPIESWQEYLPALINDIQAPYLTLWDRGWPCMTVYDTLLERPGAVGQRLEADPWLAEWHLGRAIKTFGSAFFLLGESPAVLAARRDATDLPVDPSAEWLAYARYAERFGYQSAMAIDPGDASSRINALVKALYWKAASYTHIAIDGYNILPPHTAGDLSSPVVALGEARNVSRYGQYTLPFSSAYTTRFARLFGDLAFNIAWTNVPETSETFISGKHVIACGKVAAKAARAFGAKEVIEVPHPAYEFRFNSHRGVAAYSEVVTWAKQQFVANDYQTA